MFKSKKSKKRKIALNKSWVKALKEISRSFKKAKKKHKRRK